MRETTQSLARDAEVFLERLRPYEGAGHGQIPPNSRPVPPYFLFYYSRLQFQALEAGTGIEPVSSGFADRGLTTWLPRRIILPEPIHRLLPFTPYGARRQLLPIFENSANLALSGQGLRIVPNAGHKGYQCYLDGWKVNGKRKTLVLQG